MSDRFKAVQGCGSQFAAMVRLLDFTKCLNFGHWIDLSLNLKKRGLFVLVGSLENEESTPRLDKKVHKLHIMNQRGQWILKTTICLVHFQNAMLRP